MGYQIILKNLLLKYGEEALRNFPVKIKPLTKKQVQVCLLVTEGKSNKEVASVLGVQTKTIKFHLTNIYDNLQLEYYENKRSVLILKLIERILKDHVGGEDLISAQSLIPKRSSHGQPLYKGNQQCLGK